MRAHCSASTSYSIVMTLSAAEFFRDAVLADEMTKSAIERTFRNDVSLSEQSRPGDVIPGSVLDGAAGQ